MAIRKATTSAARPRAARTAPYDDESTADQQWNAQLGIERCETLVRALEHELGGNHASLIAMLRRELDAIDKYVEGGAV